MVRSTSLTIDAAAYDTMLGRCRRATVGASDDDIFGQTIQSAFNHITFIPVAHSCAKETLQLGCAQESFGEAATAKYVHFFAQALYANDFVNMTKSRVSNLA